MDGPVFLSLVYAIIGYALALVSGVNHATKRNTGGTIMAGLCSIGFFILAGASMIAGAIASK